MRAFFLFITLIVWLSACQTNSTKKEVDLIVYNAKVYTVNATFETAEAFAINEGKFVAIGTTQDIKQKYQAKTEIDAKNKSIYPGLYDAHCHFYGYGQFLQEVNLVGTNSPAEIIEKLKEYQRKNPQKTWIVGRGWDQNDWEKKEFPTKEMLDAVFPDQPVFLTRVDGHAAWVNSKAMKIAGISETQNVTIEGGSVMQKDNKNTGIFVDNATLLIEKHIPPYSATDMQKALQDAQAQCFAVGLTTVSDAGLGREVLEVIDQMHKKGTLDMRIYAMLSSDEATLAYYLPKGIYKTDKLSIRSVKVYADGALGSRGACLLAPYADRPNEKGFLLRSPDSLKILIERIAEKGFQANTHCIGDSANRLILNLYAHLLKGKNDKRWRIEHAQVVEEADFAKFGQYNILPSVQPTHATSDMYWAGDRLGNTRLKNAYAFKKLYEQNQMIPFGSDFPVEHINPLYGFHAAVARKDAKGFPEKGFQMENAVSREIALKAMTIWAAFANFEEKERGSIEVGKMADFIITMEDFMQVPEEKIREVSIWQTFVGGKKVYEKK
ncbi:MAG: amidohydrolase [Cytophagales bacterium]|nr:MAG: amidohydrolase [Cytophagales bacterium]